MDLNDTGEANMWRCGQCNQTFSQRVLLQMHICTQSPDKPFHCGHCPTVFKEASELRDHVVTHINEKPFKCGFCGRSFAGATTLNNHIRTHTGEKPFKCRKCNKTFTQSTQLSRHLKNPEECVPSTSSSEKYDWSFGLSVFPYSSQRLCRLCVVWYRCYLTTSTTNWFHSATLSRLQQWITMKYSDDGAATPHFTAKAQHISYSHWINMKNACKHIHFLNEVLLSTLGFIKMKTLDSEYWILIHGAFLNNLLLRMRTR